LQRLKIYIYSIIDVSFRSELQAVKDNKKQGKILVTTDMESKFKNIFSVMLTPRVQRAKGIQCGDDSRNTTTNARTEVMNLLSSTKTAIAKALSDGEDIEESRFLLTAEHHQMISQHVHNYLFLGMSTELYLSHDTHTNLSFPTVHGTLLYYCLFLSH
jgi:hypothetical protein